MLLLDGKVVRKNIAKTLEENFKKFSRRATLAIVQIGDLAPSNAYIKQKKLFGESIGVVVKHLKLLADSLESDIVGEIQKLNTDESVQGIIVQLPLPKNINISNVLNSVNKDKDVDGLTATNFRKLAEGVSGYFIPATARGVCELLEYYKVPIAGERVVVVGRSMLVGKPTALALLLRGATVTITHSQTKNLAEVTRLADILIVAIGKPRFITDEYVSQNQVVVDVGINDISGEKFDEEIPKRHLVGDIDFDSVKNTVRALSPVPGGVGPMTVLALFENLFDVCRKSQKS